MSHAIYQALHEHQPQAFERAHTWLASCKYNTPDTWLTYSKLVKAYIEQLPYYHERFPDHDIARIIIRYYTLTFERITKDSWQPLAFLELHNSVEAWKTIPSGVWYTLHQSQWTPTHLYQWSLDNEEIQQKTLNTRAPGLHHNEPMHVRMGSAILQQCFKSLPLLVDCSVHWNLWTVFHGEEVYQTSKDLSRKIAMLVNATPTSFEHAITEFYQCAEHMFTQERCKILLGMDLRLGHRATTCSGVLLLYNKFKSKNQTIFNTIKNTYPTLLQGFDIHLNIYSDIENALLNIDALMPHWMHCVDGQKSEGPFELPGYFDSVYANNG